MSYLGATPVYRTKVNCKQTKWPPTLESSTEKGGYDTCYLFTRDINISFVFPSNFTSMFMQLNSCIVFIGIH